MIVSSGARADGQRTQELRMLCRTLQEWGVIATKLGSDSEQIPKSVCVRC